MLKIVATVVWGMALSLVGLGTAISINRALPGGFKSALAVSIDREWHDEPQSVGAWVNSQK